MAANVVSLFRRVAEVRDWSAAEVAEFYRVEASLVQAGVSVETERGVSDEGEPWFAFCRSDSGEVIVHIARIGASYVLAGPAFGGIAQGKDIRLMIADLLSRHPIVSAGGRSREGNVFLHPAMLLVAVVCTAFFKTSEAQALAGPTPQDADSGRANVVGGAMRLAGGPRTNSEGGWVAIDAAQAAIMITAVASVLETLREVFDDSGVNTKTNELPLISIDAPEGTRAKNVAALEPTTIDWQALNQTEAGDHFLSEIGFQGQQVDGNSVAQVLALLGTLWDLDQDSVHSFANFIEPTAHFDLAYEDNIEYRPNASPGFGDRPQLLLELTQSQGALPNVQSAHVLQADGIATKLQVSQIAHLSELPSLLQSVLVVGPHIQVGFAGSQMALQESSLEIAPDVFSDTGSPVEDLQGVLNHFFASAGNFATIVSGDDLVIYDIQAMATHASELKSFTWDFADGSSLSLVGLAASLPHFHVAA